MFKFRFHTLATLSGCTLMLVRAAVGAPSADAEPWRFRLGPFLEFGRNEAGVEMRAVRPLYSSVTSAADDSGVRDVAWPAASFYRRGSHETGRILIAGWSIGSDAGADVRRSRWLFPLYMSGRTREDFSYQACFPFYGDIPELFSIQDIHFFLFPFYLRYRTSQTQRQFMPWPFVRRAERDDGDIRYSFFPLYGSVKTDGMVQSYVFWPFWTQQMFEQEGRRGRAEMLFPIYARVKTESERSWMALPPFIYQGGVSNKTGVSTCTRAPWPFVVHESGPGYTRESYWPVYGTKTHTMRDSRARETYVLWPFINSESSSRPGVLFTSDRCFPFYFSDERVVAAGNGREAARDRYTRVWPLWSYQTKNDRFRLRLLELWPMKNGGGIERNWAPFWTWFVRTGAGASVRDTDVLWGLARWGETPQGGRYGQVSGLFSWRREAEGAARIWRLLGMRVAGANASTTAGEREP